MVGRSVLQPGWNWDEYVKPHTDGDQSCPMTHNEYVISGQIRYLTDEGDEVIAGPGDHLWIGPGHRAWVIGEEPFVAIDFEVGELEEDERLAHARPASSWSWSACSSRWLTTKRSTMSAAVISPRRGWMPRAAHWASVSPTR